jgi:hypothetical protein
MGSLLTSGLPSPHVRNAKKKKKNHLSVARSHHSTTCLTLEPFPQPMDLSVRTSRTTKQKAPMTALVALAIHPQELSKGRMCVCVCVCV